MLGGAVENYSLDGLWGVLGGPKIALGWLRERPGGGQEAPKMASGGEKVPKSAQEGFWRDLGAENDEASDSGSPHLEALGRPLGRLWAVLVALFWVMLLRIAFVSIFYRFSDVFGMVFGTKNQRKNGWKTKLILKCFFLTFFAMAL